MPLGPTAREFLTCAVSDCRDQVLARGLCIRHYHQARRTNTLPKRESNNPPLVPYRVWLSESADRELRRIARVSGRSCSALIRDALDKYLARAEPAEQAAPNQAQPPSLEPPSRPASVGASAAGKGTP